MLDHLRLALVNSDGSKKEIELGSTELRSDLKISVDYDRSGNQNSVSCHLNKMIWLTTTQQ